MGRGEHETDVGLVQSAKLALGARRDVDAEGGQHVGRARTRRHRLGAVLGDLDPGPGDDEGDRRGDVQGVSAVAAGAADVDHLIRVVEHQGFAAHGAGEGGDLAHRLAAQAHGGDRGRKLSWAGFAAEAGGEEGLGILLAQGLAVGEAGEEWFESGGHFKLRPAL